MSALTAFNRVSSQDILNNKLGFLNSYIKEFEQLDVEQLEEVAILVCGYLKNFDLIDKYGVRKLRWVYDSIIRFEEMTKTQD